MTLTVRHHTCRCGSNWTAPVRYEPTENVISSERTYWCPACGKRPIRSSEAFVLVPELGKHPLDEVIEQARKQIG